MSNEDISEALSKPISQYSDAELVPILRKIGDFDLSIIASRASQLNAFRGGGLFEECYRQELQKYFDLGSCKYILNPR